MTNTTDGHIDVGSHVFDERRNFRREALAPENYLTRIILAFQAGTEALQNIVGKFLAIVQQADPKSFEAIRPCRQRLWRHI